MTADLYATATGLIERSAAACASGVPEGAEDDSFFGPSNVTWRVSSDLASPVAGLRSLLMQALHPLAMAGVDQHSGWRRDPVGRLAATSAYLATVTFGERAAAVRAAARVRRIHNHVHGTDAVTGQPYAAGDPDLLLWVHAALVDSVLAAASLVGTALSAADSNSYVAEMVTAAELAGVPRPLVPSEADTRMARGTSRLTRRAKEMSRDHDDARNAAPTRRATAADRWRLARRSGPVACLVCRIGRRPAGARMPAPIRRGADYRADRGFDGAAGRQGGRGQYRVTGAGPAAGRARLPGRRGLPGDQLPVRAARLGPGRMAGRRPAAGQER
jgi:hypothetical protein